MLIDRAATLAFVTTSRSEPASDGPLEEPSEPPLSKHRIRWTLKRREWLATEWPALALWGALAAASLLLVAIAVTHSWWGLWLLPAWWFLGGSKAVGIATFLVRGSELNELVIPEDGIVLLETAGSAPVYAHWRAFVDEGPCYVLLGGDGRYRLVIPKRALHSEDYAAIERSVGIDLTALHLHQEARIERQGAA